MLVTGGFEWRFLPAIGHYFCIFGYYNNSTDKTLSWYGFPKNKKLARLKKLEKKVYGHSGNLEIIPSC